MNHVENEYTRDVREATVAEFERLCEEAAKTRTEVELTPMVDAHVIAMSWLLAKVSAPDPVQLAATAQQVAINLITLMVAHMAAKQKEPANDRTH